MHLGSDLLLCILSLLCTICSVSATAITLPGKQPYPFSHTHRSSYHRYSSPTLLRRSKPFEEALSDDGWRIRYTRVASFIPVQFAATAFIAFHSQLSWKFEKLMNAGTPSQTNPAFQAKIGDVKLSMLCKTGRLTWDFMNEVVLELLEVRIYATFYLVSGLGKYLSQE